MKGRKGTIQRASGGRIEVAGGNPSVIAEARSKRKAGGRVAGKSIGSIGGGASRMRLDRPGRKRGGRVGADSSPLSSAHSAGSAEKAS